ncbi:MAG: amino acid permease [Gammaproteobacteria bacterium]|nr:amino acid permease [Gammaproteobacteria bacterium]
MRRSPPLFRTKPIETNLSADTGLHRSLTAFDLTVMGIGAIIGAGIFVLTGISAATEAGPAIVLSFVLSGSACAFAALSYAELASTVGGAGSAYGYGYAALGELPAWIIGWMLILEYIVAISTVAVGWSGYVHDGLASVGLAIPPQLLHGPFDPQAPGLIDLPATLIIVALGLLLANGAKVSARFNAVVVTIKLIAIAIFIAVALKHLNPALWHPFIPPAQTAPAGTTHFGVIGIFQGAALIFFAYIGFDAVSTAAEETRKPQRDLPIGIIGSLAICTILYIVVSALLTGIVPYQSLNVGSPVAKALLDVGENWAAGLISIGAIAGLTTVMLVLYYAITRILFAISRDGLLPRFLAVVNPRSKSPVRCITLVGATILLLAGFVPINRLAELTNIGTLGAFVVVCAGVIVLRHRHPDLPRGFRTPWSPLIPALGVLACFGLMTQLQAMTWIAFAIWLACGLTLYFGYARWHSVLSAAEPSP